MEGSIEQYIRREGGKTTIHRSIIGKNIQASDRCYKEEVLDVGSDAFSGYIKVLGPEGIYGIRIPVFRFFRIIE